MRQKGTVSNPASVGQTTTSTGAYTRPRASSITFSEDPIDITTPGAFPEPYALIILGNGFDSTPLNNTVVFNLGAEATVVAASYTQLTVNFTTLPQSTGSLLATVSNSGGTSAQNSVALVI